MKNSKTKIILFAILVIAVTSTHISWTEDEFGLLLTVDERPVDVRGLVENQFNRFMRNCDSVQLLNKADIRFQLAEKLINEYSPPHSEQADVAGVWEYENWLMVEVEFKKLEPVALLIENTDKVPRIVPSSVWSGYTSPRKSGPFIRHYIRQRIEDPPTNLLQCFEPRSQSFTIN